MTKIIVDTEEIYTLEEAAELLGIGIATVFRWMKSGKIIPLKINERTLIPKSEIERLRKERGVQMNKKEIEATTRRFRKRGE